MIVEFEKAYYGDNYRKDTLKKLKENPMIHRNKKIFKDKKIEVQACLRKRVEFKEEISSKKIKLSRRSPNFYEKITPLEKDIERLEAENEKSKPENREALQKNVMINLKKDKVDSDTNLNG